VLNALLLIAKLTLLVTDCYSDIPPNISAK